MRYRLTVEGRVLTAETDGDGVRLADAAPPASPSARRRSRTGVARVIERGEGSLLWLTLDGRPYRLRVRHRGDGAWEVHFRGRSFRVEVADERSWRAHRTRKDGAGAAAGPGPLLAPMPGLVLRVDVQAGQEVAPGQGLLIVEAMKMENELRARAAGRVRNVRVAAGESVRRGDLLIEFEEPGEVGREGGRGASVGRGAADSRNPVAGRDRSDPDRGRER